MPFLRYFCAPLLHVLRVLIRMLPERGNSSLDLDQEIWVAHQRGIPIEDLARESGVTRERMRFRLERFERGIEARAKLAACSA